MLTKTEKLNNRLNLLNFVLKKFKGISGCTTSIKQLDDVYEVRWADKEFVFKADALLSADWEDIQTAVDEAIIIIQYEIKDIDKTDVVALLSRILEAFQTSVGKT